MITANRTWEHLTPETLVGDKPLGVHIARQVTVLDHKGKWVQRTRLIPVRVLFAGTDTDGVRWWTPFGIETRPGDEIRAAYWPGGRRFSGFDEDGRFAASLRVSA